MLLSLSGEVGITVKTAQRMCNLVDLSIRGEYHLQLAAQLSGITEGGEIYHRA